MDRIGEKNLYHFMLLPEEATRQINELGEQIHQVGFGPYNLTLHPHLREEELLFEPGLIRNVQRPTKR